MSKKVTAVVLIVALALAVGVMLRSANRADAAAGDCYAETKGPSEPAICS